MKLTILGTGNALVTECYNTCFILDDNGQYFMVNGGGGNAVLKGTNFTEGATAKERNRQIGGHKA